MSPPAGRMFVTYSPSSLLLTIISSFNIGAEFCTENLCPQQTIKLTLYNTPKLGKFNRRFVASGLETFVEPGAVQNPLDFKVTADFDTPCKPNIKSPLHCTFAKAGNSVVKQRVEMNLRLFEESWGFARDRGLSGRRQLGDECTNSLYGNYPCCNECVNDYTEMYSDFHMDLGESIYQSFDIWNGVDVVFELEICNALNFDIYIGDVEVDVVFSDLDGYDTWFFGSQPNPTETEIASLTNNFVTSSSIDGWHVPSGNCSVSPSFKATTGLSVDVFNGLYDEYNKGRICLSSLGNFTVGVRAPNKPVFHWKQPIKVPKINVLGTNIDMCASPSACTTLKSVAARFPGSSSDPWSLNGGASATSSVLKLEKNSGGGDTPSAWWKPSKIDIADDWSVNFTVAEQTTGTLGFAGMGFCFVLQNDSNDLTASSSNSYGYSGIINSLGVCFDVSGTNELKIYSGGSTSSVYQDPSGGGETYSSAWDLDLDSVESRDMSIVYESLTQILRVYYDPSSSSGVELAVKIDLNETLKGTMARAGFVAEIDSSTGASTYEIRKLIVNSAETNLAMSLIEGGNRVHELKSGFLVLDARTSCGTPRRSGGESFSSIKLVHKKTSRSVEGLSAVDLGGGRYKIDYVGCDKSTLDLFEYCSDFNGKYALIVDGVEVGVIRLLAGET